MKRVSVIRVLLSLAFLPGCQKEDNSNNATPEAFRLAAIEIKSGAGVFHRDFEYDGNGRIIRSSSYFNNSTPQTDFIVTYNGNEAVFLKTITNIPGTFTTDTIRFILEANNNATKRIEKTFYELTATPQRTYIYDTTVYEYDAAGLLKKETRGYRDTSWFNRNGTITTTNTRTNVITTHTITNGNVVSTFKTTTTVATTYFNGNISYGYGNQEVTRSFQYNNLYPNKTDFSNLTILNELSLFKGWTLSKGYMNLPEKIVSTRIEKDPNGAIISTTNSTDLMVATFDSNGYLSTLTDPAYNSISTFIYK